MVSLALKLYPWTSLIRFGCPRLALNRPWAGLKALFLPSSEARSSACGPSSSCQGPFLGGFPALTMRYTWLGLSALFVKKQLFITIIYLRFYQNAMTLSSPRINGVATICFFSGLPSVKLMKFVTARQQMKRTVGATP